MIRTKGGSGGFSDGLPGLAGGHGGAGALAASLKQEVIASHTGDKRKTVVAILSGGNCDQDIFAQALAAPTLI